MNRTKNLQKLKTEQFDICIIGAGASGAGCALDAMLRGFKVALIDQQDFAAETSSRSTKLIHGGVRYLEQDDVSAAKSCWSMRATLKPLRSEERRVGKEC